MDREYIQSKLQAAAEQLIDAGADDNDIATQRLRLGIARTALGGFPDGDSPPHSATTTLPHRVLRLGHPSWRFAVGRRRSPEREFALRCRP